MSFADYVKDTLMQVISSVASCPESSCVRPGTDFTRNRKLPLKELLTLCICMGPDSTAMEIFEYFNFDTAAPSSSAFIQQRAKLNPDVFRSIFRLFNSHFRPVLFLDRYQLVACDGSAFSYTRFPQDADCYFPPDGKSSSGYNQLHVTALYDILSRRFCDATVQPARSRNEYLSMAQMVRQFTPSAGTPVFIADRGFASYNVFANVIERGFFFLIRIDDRRFRRLLGPDSPGQDAFDLHITRILSRSSSKKKRLHPELASQYRYICNEVPFDFLPQGSDGEYTLRLRVLRFAVSDGSYENIVTNLPDLPFTPDLIRHIYHLRWDVETSFRELKYVLAAARFHSRKFLFICMELWARLILYNFCSVITENSTVHKKDTRHEYQPNRTISFKVCRHFLSVHSGSDPPDMDGLTGSFTLPVRPGRSFDRHMRTRVPSSLLYRM